MAQWCQTNKIPLDLDKTSLIHFTRSTKDNNPPIRLPSSATLQGPRLIEATTKDNSLRWLGVHFDRCLTFKHHVQKVTAKAKTTAQTLRMLGECTRGLPPKLAQQLITACVLPTLLYASKAWWSPPNTPRRRSAGLSERIDLVLRSAMRAILPVYKTTPVPCLIHASGLPPAEVLLDHASQRAAVRLARLNPQHPLQIRLNRAPLTTTRLRLTVALPPARIKNSNPLALPPWHPPQNPWPPPATRHNRHAQAAAFSEWKLAQNPRDFWVFLDGSKLDNGCAGAGWVFYQGEHKIASGHTPCGQYAKVFDAEASALALGLHAATTHLAACAANTLWACLDNAAVVESAQRGTGSSSQKKLQAAAELFESWATRPRSMENIVHAGQAHVLWVPGHAGVMGNKLADIEAKKAAALPLERHPKEATAAGATRWTRAALRTDIWNSWMSFPQRQDLPLPALGLGCPPILSLPRPVLARLLAARSGHGDFAKYHECFGHTFASIHCRCGARTTLTHFFFCRHSRQRHLLEWHKGLLTLQEILTTSRGAEAFGRWL